MSFKTSSKSFNLVQTLVKVVEELDIQQHINQLYNVAEIIQGVLMCYTGQNKSISDFITALKNNCCLVEQKGKILLIPPNYPEIENTLLSQLDKLFYLSDPKNFQSEDSFTIQNQYILEISNQNRKFPFEDVLIFMEYLFKVKNSDVSDQQRLDLFLLLADEYSKLLKDKDIKSMTILGQKTIEMISNNVYDQINNHQSLNHLKKDSMSHEIRRFFFAIKQIVLH